MNWEECGTELTEVDTYEHVTQGAKLSFPLATGSCLVFGIRMQKRGLFTCS